jgi:CheY-like chemotaxis protein
MPSSRCAKPKSRTVLLVDDEDLVLKTCASLVEHLGFRTWTASNGEDAVSVFREHAREIDCVILDLTMPKMDGVAAFDELRSVRPDIKVILSSGFAREGAVKRFAGKGLTGFLQKPCELNGVRGELERVLRSAG